MTWPGYKQGAEIISWTIGERFLGPQIPDDDPRVLEAGYELLTGVRSPAFQGEGSDR